MTDNHARRRLAGGGPFTLAIDVGGTGLKASVLDAAGVMLAERVRVETPHPCPPKLLVETLARLVEPLPPYDRISVGFPGVVRTGRVLTAPHFGNDLWRGQPLARMLEKRFGRAVRMLNDAEIQGLGMIAGRGLEVVLTLGTGIGCALFEDGRLAPHLELSQHPLHKDKTYDDYLGNEARRRCGDKKWSRRVLRMIAVVDTLMNYDQLYLGGGNAERLTLALPERVMISSNDAGITGGIHLWDKVADHAFTGAAPARLRSAG